MWLEDSCLTPFEGGTLSLIYTFTNGFGNLLSGYLNNWVYRVAPKHGRIYLAQFSIGSGMLCCLYIFFYLPFGEKFWLYCLMFSLFGTLSTWCAVINVQIFAEIVSEDIRSTIYSLDKFIEGIVATIGAPLTGLLTDYIFGYKTTKIEEINCNRANARALGNGLFYICFGFWSICFLFYTSLHWFYPRDLERIQGIAKNKLRLNKKIFEIEKFLFEKLFF